MRGTSRLRPRLSRIACWGWTLNASILLAVAAIHIGCSGGSDRSPSEPSEPVPSTTPTDGNSTETSTLRMLSTVTSSVRRGAYGELVSLAEFSEVACTTGGGVGAAICLQGEPAGTLVRVFNFSACASLPVRESQLSATLQTQLPAAARLYAAYQDPSNAGLIGIIYEVSGEGRELQISSGKITALTSKCSTEVKQMIPTGATLLIPPQF